MKKLLTLMCAVALSAAFAATLSGTSGTTFAGLTAGDAFSASGAAAEGGKYYWYSADAQSGTNFALAANYNGACGRPNQFANDSTLIALAVDADAPLYRAAEGSASAFASPSFTQIDIGDGGLYIDTLIRFEICRDEADIADDTGKLAIWLNSTSNLVVTAGQTEDEVFSTNDYTTVVAYNPETWYRLTIKSFMDNGDQKFNVYIDGEAVTAGGVTDFPSLVQSATQLSALALQGVGTIDDISFTEALPNFLGVAEINGTYYVTLDAALAAAGENDVINVIANPGVESIELPTISGISISDPNGYLNDKVTAPNGYILSQSGTSYTLIDNTASTWIGASGGAWSTGSNWSTGYVPTQYTTVTLPDGAAITVTGTSALPVNNLVVNGEVTLTCTGDLGNNWPSIGIYGNVTGTSNTLKLERVGLKSLSGGAVTVGCNIYFDGKGYDCFLESGSFVFNGSFTGTNQLDILTTTTFNGAVTIPDGTILRIGKNGTYPTVSFGGSATLSGDGTIVIWSNNYNAINAAALTGIKAKLQSAAWQGVCELSGTMQQIDFGYFGNSGSVVRANGLSGFLRFSLGSTTEIASGILALDIGSNGLTMNNQFTSGVDANACHYIFGAALTGSGTMSFATTHNNGSTKSLYTFTGDVRNFAGAINYGTITDYRAVVVFRTTDESDPTPTDYGQIIVTANKTVNVHGTWYGAGGFLIYGTVNMASGATLTCDSNRQKICGDGVIRYAELPASALTFGTWTGTAVIDYAGPSERIDLAASVNKIGIAGSTVEIAEGCTIPGKSYFGSSVVPTLKVSGFVSINDGSSGTKQTVPNLTGNGVLVFGTNGAMVNYAVNNVVDWNGVITNSASATLVTNIVSGTGTCVDNVGNAAVNVSASWTGTYVIGWNPVANAYFDINNYGTNADAKIVFRGTWPSGAYFGNGTAAAYTITSELQLDSPIVIDNGYSGSDKVVTITKLSGSANLTTRRYGYMTASVQCYYAIARLENYTGELIVRDAANLDIGIVNVPSDTDLTGRIARVSKSKYYDSTVADGVVAGDLKLYVDGVDTGKVLKYKTDGSDAGLYLNEDTVDVNGQSVNAALVFDNVVSTNTITYQGEVTVSTNDETGVVTVGYKGSSTTAEVPAYYDVTVEEKGDVTEVTLTLNQNAVPDVGTEDDKDGNRVEPMTFDKDESKVSLGVRTSNEKLYYGISCCTTADGNYPPPDSLIQGTGSALKLDCSLPDSNNVYYFKVYVTDIAPKAP